MGVGERRRADLFERLASSIGREATSTLFEMLPPPGKDLATSADVGAARAETTSLGASLRSEMRAMEASLRSDMQAMEASLRSDMQAMEARLREEMASLRGEVKAGQLELLATFRKELNDALAHNTRMMLLGLASTLLSAIGLAAVLSRFTA